MFLRLLPVVAEHTLLSHSVLERFLFQGKFGEAEPLYKRSLAIDEKAYGPDHPEVAEDLANWAVVLYQQVKAIILMYQYLSGRDSSGRAC